MAHATGSTLYRIASATSTFLVAALLCFLYPSAASVAQNFSAPQSLVYDSHQGPNINDETPLGSFVRMDPKVGLALNLAEVQRLKKVIERTPPSQQWIPKEARRARTKDEFLRIIAEHHVKDLFLNSSLSQWKLAELVAKAERTLKNGLTYNLKDDDKETEASSQKGKNVGYSQQASSSQAAESLQAEEDVWSLAPKSLGFLFEPREGKARIYMKADSYTAELSRSMNKNETTIQFVVPEVLKGQLTFLLSSNAEEMGKLGYRFNW